MTTWPELAAVSRPAAHAAPRLQVCCAACCAVLAQLVAVRACVELDRVPAALSRWRCARLTRRTVCRQRQVACTLCRNCGCTSVTRRAPACRCVPVLLCRLHGYPMAAQYTLCCAYTVLCDDSVMPLPHTQSQSSKRHICTLTALHTARQSMLTGCTAVPLPSFPVFDDRHSCSSASNATRGRATRSHTCRKTSTRLHQTQRMLQAHASAGARSPPCQPSSMIWILTPSFSPARRPCKRSPGQRNAR